MRDQHCCSHLCAAVFSNSFESQCTVVTFPQGVEAKTNQSLLHIPQHAPNFLGLFRDIEEPLKGDCVCGNLSSELGKI